MASAATEPEPTRLWEATVWTDETSSITMYFRSEAEAWEWTERFPDAVAVEVCGPGDEE